jgi:hypothetical protein
VSTAHRRLNGAVDDLLDEPMCGGITRVRCAGTGSRTELRMWCTAALTGAAAAPAAATSDGEDSRAPTNVAGAVPIATGTVAAPGTTNGQIRAQYSSWLPITRSGRPPAAGADEATAVAAKAFDRHGGQ